MKDTNGQNRRNRRKGSTGDTLDDSLAELMSSYTPKQRQTLLKGFVDDQDLYTIVITTYIPPRQVGDGPWTPWYADYYHPAV